MPAVTRRGAWSLVVASTRTPAAPGASPRGAEEPAASPEERQRFRDLVLPHLDSAYNLARYLVLDGDAAEDIVQDAFLRAVRGFPGFRGGDARAWILAIVRNCCRAWINDRRRAPLPSTASCCPSDEEDDASGIADRWDPAQDSPETALLRQSEAEAVRGVIARIPQPFREVLVLRELEELSYREIANVTAAPIGTVMSRLARARTMFGLAWQHWQREHGA